VSDKLDFSICSPTYAEYEATWREALDFYRSGHHVLQPSRAVGRVGFWVQTDAPQDDGSTEPEPRRRRSRYETVPVQSYLWSHVRESRAEYDDRKARAVHVPLFRNAVDLFVSAALRVEPDRSAGASDLEPWGTYWDDVDMRGTNIGAFVRQAATYALVYGVMYAVTDRPRFLLPAVSRAEQLARGERAYSYLVSPLDVPRWSLDSATGAWRWVIVRDTPPDESAPGGPSLVADERFRVWYVDRSELYGKPTNGGDWTLLDVAEHNVGEVPIAPLFARASTTTRSTLEPDSMLASLVRGDRHIFNGLSVIHDVIAKQAWSQLCLPDDGTGMATLDVGPAVALLYNSQFGTPIMLTPDSSIIMAQWQILAGELQMFRESVGAGRGKAEYSKEERSADALTVESRHENNRVASLVESIEEFDRTLHRHVARWEGASEYPRASYGRDVSLDSVADQLSDALSMKSLGLGPEVMREIIRPIVVRYMRQQSQSPDAIARATESLDLLEEKAEEQV